MWTEIKRKFLHLISLVYVAGLIFIPRWKYLTLLSVWLVIEFSIEQVRIKNSKVHAWFSSHFQGLFREEEHDKFTGIFWMLTGIITTIFLVPSIPLAVSAILYLILGDAAASLIGKRLGGPRWPGSNKRLAGSMACFLVCIFIGVIFLKPFGWHGIIIGAIVATVFEKGIFPINDNFSIPVASGLALLASYKVPLIFL